MALKQNQPIDITQVDARLQQWRNQHNTPAKVAAQHRNVLLERVSQSMAFENQPVSTDRLNLQPVPQSQQIQSQPPSPSTSGAPPSGTTPSRDSKK